MAGIQAVDAAIKAVEAINVQHRDYDDWTAAYIQHKVRLQKLYRLHEELKDIADNIHMQTRRA